MNDIFYQLPHLSTSMDMTWNSDTQFFQVRSAAVISTSENFQLTTELEDFLLIYVRTGQLSVQLQSHTSASILPPMTISSERILLLLPEQTLSFASTKPLQMSCIQFTGALTREYLSLADIQSGHCYLESHLPSLLDQINQVIDVVREDSPSHQRSAPFPFIIQRCFTDLMTLFYRSRLLPVNYAGNPLPSYLDKIHSYITANYAMHFSLEDIATLGGVSKYKFAHDFKQFYGVSPLQYVNELRILHSRDLLLQTDDTVREVGSAVGIEDTNHFINLFKRHFGMTPLHFREMN